MEWDDQNRGGWLGPRWTPGFDGPRFQSEEALRRGGKGGPEKGFLLAGVVVIIILIFL
jgi:hypothetical protein